jgi:hypothetical protein
MKHFKIVLISLIVGLAIGLALGVNIGRDKPLLSNPFEHESLEQKLKRLGGETLEKSGKALEKGGQELQNKGNK